MTCVIVNETDSKLVATGAELEHQVSHGQVVGALPHPIDPDQQGRFTLTQAPGAEIGPSAWFCYALEGQSIEYLVGAGDPAHGADSFSVAVNYYARLGEASWEIERSGPNGPLKREDVAAERDLTITYRLRFNPKTQVSKDPSQSPGVAKAVAVAPNAPAALVVPPFIHRWDHPKITQKRKKVLAAIHKLYPMIWEAKGSPARQAPKENGGGTFRIMDVWTDKLSTSCTSSCPMVGEAVSPKTSKLWTFNAHKSPAWVVWGKGTQKMPSVGDVYILYRDEVVRPYPPEPKKPTTKFDAKDRAWREYASMEGKHNPHQRHVGIVVQVPTSASEVFYTADGGQTVAGVQAAQLVKRAWSQRKPGPTDASRMKTWESYMKAKDHAFANPVREIDCAYLAGGAESKSPSDGNRLVGWIDIDQLEFTDERFDTTYTEQDYLDFGARLKAM